jgi:hypothetical protein
MVEARNTNHNVILGCKAAEKGGKDCVGFGTNIYIGSGAGMEGCTAAYNVVLGASASLQSSGSFNIAIGYAALRGCCGSVSSKGCNNNNIVLGCCAMFCACGSERNIVMGHRAGFCGCQTENDIFIGHCAGYCQRGSFGNVYIGNEAGRGLGSGCHHASDNVAIGNSAGYGVDTGHRNVLIGVGAGRCVCNFSDNVAIGATALGGLCGSSGGCNVAIGRNALSNARSSAKCNVAIGVSAAYNVRQSTCCTVAIGVGVTLPMNPNGSDGCNTQMAVGIHTGRWLTGNSAFNVGVGTVGAGTTNILKARMHVEGSIHASRFFQNPISLLTNTPPFATPPSSGKVVFVKSDIGFWKKREA